MSNVVIRKLKDGMAVQWREGRSAVLIAGALTVGAAVVPFGAGAYTARPAFAAALPPVSTCAPDELVIWLNTQSNADAGSILYRLEFTNLSAMSCRLQGFPHVVGTGTGGKQLGSPASENHAEPPRPVTLVSGGTAFAVLHIAVASVFPPSGCGQTMAAALRIHAPGQVTSKVVPFPFPACSRSGPAYLQIEAMQPTR